MRDVMSFLIGDDISYSVRNVATPSMELNQRLTIAGDLWETAFDDRFGKD